MRVHARLSASSAPSACRALIGGFGRPGQRDLDFGEKFIRYAEDLEWPDGVVVEDLSYAAHLVLHRLQELRPAKVVFVGAVSRGVDPPGTVRRYRLDPAPSPPEDVHACLTGALSGEVGLDHTLAVARHWGCLPSDTAVIEVEAADSSFGLGFSEELADAMDGLLDVVREEVGDPVAGHLEQLAAISAVETVASSSPPPSSAGAAPVPVAGAPPHGIAQLFEYVDAHAQVRSLEALSQHLPAVAGLSIASRFQPATRVLRTSGNWYDVLPLNDGAVGLVMGDVTGHGVRAASGVAQLRSAVRALALVEGRAPARIVEHLEKLAESLDAGKAATVVYASVDGRTGDGTLSNAGHCLPLLVTPGGGAEFLEEGFSAPLGVLGRSSKQQMAFRLLPGSMLLLFTAGLLESASAPIGALQRLRRAAANGPLELEALCDHVLDVCLDDQPRNEDVSLLVVRAEARTGVTSSCRS